MIAGSFGRCMFILRETARASLVVQWLRIHLPVQGTWVRALVQEFPTCRGVTKSVSHTYWSPCAWSPCSVTRETTAMRSSHTATRSSPCSPQLEKKPVHSNEDPTQPKINKLIKKKKRNCPTLFQNGCTILHSHKQWMRVSVAHILTSNWCCQCPRFWPF